MSNPVRYRIRHETIYRYESDVVHSHQLLHLVPRPSRYQRCIEHQVTVTPGTYRNRNEVDAFGNLIARAEFDHPHRQLEIATDMEVDVYARPAVLLRIPHPGNGRRPISPIVAMNPRA